MASARRYCGCATDGVPWVATHLILIGMPGGGKTTVGRQLARQLGLPFFDSDHVIEAHIGQPIRAYFEVHGESAFRDVEQQVIGELTAGTGCVLATGGDVVFYGTLEGWFVALDARTGTELWKFHTASGIVGNPITYLGPDGKQYVAIYSGVGGWMGAVAFPTVSADDPYAGLGVVGAMKDIKKYTAPGSTVYVFGF